MSDREKVISGLSELEGFLFSKYGKVSANEANIWYDRFLAVSDAIALLKEQEEIIYCKDCYYYHKPEFGFTFGDCTYRNAWYQVAENGFCSLAKRKEGR